MGGDRILVIPLCARIFDSSRPSPHSSLLHQQNGKVCSFTSIRPLQFHPLQTKQNKKHQDATQALLEFSSVGVLLLLFFKELGECSKITQVALDVS